MGKRDDLLAKVRAAGLTPPARPTIALLEQQLHQHELAKAGADPSPGPGDDGSLEDDDELGLELDPDDLEVLARAEEERLALEGDPLVDVSDDDDDDDEPPRPPAGPEPVSPDELPDEVRAILHPPSSTGELEAPVTDLGAGDHHGARYELVVHYASDTANMHEQAQRQALERALGEGKRPAGVPIIAHDTPAKSARRRLVVHVPLEGP